MKNLIIALVFTMTLSSCDSNPSPLTYSGCDGQEIDGIAFEYCLLNSQMEDVTELLEGENFFFKFTVRNKTGKEYYFYPQYANDAENDFCTVYTVDGQKVGKPYVLNALNLIGIGGSLLVKMMIMCLFSLGSIPGIHHGPGNMEPIPVPVRTRYHRGSIVHLLRKLFDLEYLAPMMN
ncbi:hypothetical protein [Leadbetterella byssophila]|uniref:hypothetical protein n=1 Tax=Leadbetterella byssophila TaxID=316068 RepID=UPI0039A2C8BB